MKLNMHKLPKVPEDEEDYPTHDWRYIPDEDYAEQLKAICMLLGGTLSVHKELDMNIEIDDKLVMYWELEKGEIYDYNVAQINLVVFNEYIKE